MKPFLSFSLTLLVTITLTACVSTTVHQQKLDENMHLQSVIKDAEKCDDIKTADLLTEQLGRYEEFSWMLRATTAS